MAEAFEELAHGSTALYGTCAGLWIMIIYAAPSTADMLLSRGTLATMTKRIPHAFPTLTWCLTEAGYRMDADARAAASEVTREYATSLAAQATLIEGEGFQGAAVRAIISGIDAMSRTASKKKVFAELTPAVRWALEVRQGGLGQTDVVSTARVIEEARRKLARPRP